MKRMLVVIALLLSLVGCQEKQQEYYVLTQDIQEQIIDYLASQEQLNYEAALNGVEPKVKFEDNAISIQLSRGDYNNFLMCQQENNDTTCEYNEESEQFECDTL